MNEREREKNRDGAQPLCVCVSLVLFTHTFCKYHIKIDESISIYRNRNKYYFEEKRIK